MTKADDAILEFLLNQGNRPLNASPAMIEANINYKISHVRSRVRKLHSAGLIKYQDEDRGIYKISDKGKGYLKGEIDADSLNEKNV